MNERFVVTEQGIVDTKRNVVEFSIPADWPAIANSLNKAARILGFDAPIGAIVALSQTDEVLFGEES